MGRKEKKTTKINKERILFTAARLMKERGVSNISLSDIAKAVKISKGTLYYYYPSKHDLVFDIAEQSMNHMTQKIFQWVEKSKEDVSPEEILKIVFDTILRAKSRGQIHFYLMLEALSDDSLRERFCQEYAKWKELILDGLNRIIPQGKENSLLAQIILASIYGFLLQTLLGLEKPPLDQISKFLVMADLSPSLPE
ncbi:MAG: TetR/AcrR family transcriptional regulator [Spirochaetes bacterium]|nr:TetR/AcrR family transcriptional regulator [Spirochaetota bacterium]